MLLQPRNITSNLFHRALIVLSLCLLLVQDASFWNSFTMTRSTGWTEVEYELQEERNLPSRLVRVQYDRSRVGCNHEEIRGVIMLSFLLMDTTTRRHCAEWTTCQTQKNEEICISLDDVFAKTRVWRIDVSQNVLFRRLKLRSSTSVLYCVGCWSSAYRPLLPSIHTGSAPCISRYDSSDICFAAEKGYSMLLLSLRQQIARLVIVVDLRG